MQNRPESSPILRDTPRTPSRERGGGVRLSPDTKDQSSALAKPSQDEELMEVVEKSEESSNQVLPHLSPERKETAGSNVESSPEIERPAVPLTLDQSQLQASSEEVPAMASAWSGPHFSPEHKELSNSPPRENSFGSPLEFRNSGGPVAEMNTGFSPEGKDLNGPFPNQLETDPSLDVKEQSTRSSRHSSSELSPDVVEKAGMSSNQSVSSPVLDAIPRTPSRERSSSASSPELKDGLPRTPSRRSRSGSSPGLRDGSGTPSRHSLSGSSPGMKDIPRTPSRGRSECDSSPEPKALPQTPRPRSRSPSSPELNNKCLTPQRERSGSESSVEQKTVARTPLGQRRVWIFSGTRWETQCIPSGEK